MSKRASADSGQALVELMLVIIICLIMGIGMYEIGVLFHNYSVMEKAISSATKLASKGAPYSKIKEQVLVEASNLLDGAFVAQTISDDPGLVVEVWNPESNTKLGANTNGYDYRKQCSKDFAPSRSNVTPYLFWAQGYDIRVGVQYQIGVYIPYIQNITVDNLIAHSRTISVSNDLDRDGLVDSWEPVYVDWVLAKKVDEGLIPSNVKWQHPSHYDESLKLDSENIDLDNDGDTNTIDNQVFDKDNDGIENKYDKASNLNENELTLNPLIGPGVQPGTNNDYWWDGSCP